MALSKAEKARRAKNAARNEKRKNQRAANRAYRDAFAKEAERMGFKAGKDGQLSGRATKAVNDSLRANRSTAKLLQGARVVETRGGAVKVGSGE